MPRYGEPNHRYIDSQKLLEFANYLYSSEQEDRDFAFIVEGKEVTCHRLIVKHGSDELRQKFEEWDSKKLDKVDLANVSFKVFNRVLQYIYTGLFNFRGLNDDDVMEGFHISHDFGLTELSTEMSTSIKDRGFLNVWNCTKLLTIAGEYHHQDMYDKCIAFIDRHAYEVLNEPVLMELESGLLKVLLQRDTLYAKEIEIYKAIEKWIEKNEPEELVRKQILDTVRISKLTKTDFESKVKPSGHYSDEDYANAVSEKKHKARRDPDVSPSVAASYD